MPAVESRICTYCYREYGVCDCEFTDHEFEDGIPLGHCWECGLLVLPYETASELTFCTCVTPNPRGY